MTHRNRSSRHVPRRAARRRRVLGRTAALGAALAGGALAVLLLPRVEVEGRSMLPTLEPGDRLVLLPRTARALLPSLVVPGRLVVLADPRQESRTLVKRLTAADGEAVLVEGDNPGQSTDSRHFGPVPDRLVRGRPVYRYAPAERAGWIWDD